MQSLFARDVERGVEAEARALHHLRNERRAEVEDVRALHLPYDFRFRLPGTGRWLRLDVKADRWLDATGNLFFESHNLYPDGSLRVTWGYNANLDIVACVGVQTFRAYFVWRKQFEQLVDAALKRDDRRVLERRYDNGPYVTVGFTVPLEMAHKEVIYRTVAYLPPVPRAEPAAAEEAVLC